MIGAVLDRSLDRFDERHASAAGRGGGGRLRHAARAPRHGDLLHDGGGGRAPRPRVARGRPRRGGSAWRALPPRVVRRGRGAARRRSRRARPARNCVGHRRHARRRAAAAGHRLRAAAGTPAVAEAVEAAGEVATALVVAGQQERAAGLLRDARDVGAECLDRPELRANIALDLAQVLSGFGDLDPALGLYQEAAELARECSDPVTRAKAEVGANLWAAAFVPDPPRVRRLEDALGALPLEQRHLRATLLGRLTVVGGADPDAGDRVRSGPTKRSRRPGPRVIPSSSPGPSSTRRCWRRVGRRSTASSPPPTRSSVSPSTRVDPTSRSTGTSAAPATTSTTAISAPPAKPWGAPKCSPRSCRPARGVRARWSSAPRSSH